MKAFDHKKIIVIATDAYHPQINGVVRTIDATVKNLINRGYDVRLITPNNFPNISFNFLIPRLKLSFPYNIKKYLNNSNAVHISTEGPIGLAVRLYCYKNNIKFTSAFHTDFAKYMNTNFKIPKLIVWKYLKWFHKISKSVMVPTKSMIKELEINGFNNCVLWSRGVDTEIFYYKNIENNYQKYPRPYFLNVGRISKEKNIEDFLNLELSGTKFVVGIGPEFNKLKNKYPEVIFKGELTGKELADSYRMADVFVFPSKFDTFGMVNIESISCGTPVAAYPVTGPCDIIENGVTGYLNDDLKQACLDCLKLQKVEGNFNWNHATEQFLSNLYFIG